MQQQSDAGGGGLRTAAKLTMGITLLGVLLTFVVSALGLWLGHQTADHQATLQRQLSQKQLSAGAPSTKVRLDVASIDPTGQVLTLGLTIRGVGAVKGYGCSLADTEQITNSALTAREGRSQDQLVVSSGTKGDYDLGPGDSVAVSARYQRSADGIIQISVASPCATPDSTDPAITVTVVSAGGSFIQPIKVSYVPVA